MASDHEYCQPHSPEEHRQADDIAREKGKRRPRSSASLPFYVALATLCHGLVYLPHWLHLSTCRVRHGAAGG
jgi:hypothetical protein